MDVTHFRLAVATLLASAGLLLPAVTSTEAAETCTGPT